MHSSQTLCKSVWSPEFTKLQYWKTLDWFISAPPNRQTKKTFQNLLQLCGIGIDKDLKIIILRSFSVFKNVLQLYGPCGSNKETSYDKLVLSYNYLYKHTHRWISLCNQNRRDSMPVWINAQFHEWSACPKSNYQSQGLIRAVACDLTYLVELNYLCANSYRFQIRK